MLRLEDRLKHRPLALAAGAMALAVLAMSAPAAAQARDPAYADARAKGEVGEKADGYLGFPAAPNPTVKRMADDINIKRKNIYAEKAQANAATVEEYAFTAGCLAILRTVAGEKYQAPDGTWRTRSAEPPLRSELCPRVN